MAELLSELSVDVNRLTGVVLENPQIHLSNSSVFHVASLFIGPSNILFDMKYLKFASRSQSFTYLLLPLDYFIAFPRSPRNVHCSLFF